MKVIVSSTEPRSWGLDCKSLASASHIINVMSCAIRHHSPGCEVESYKDIYRIVLMSGHNKEYSKHIEYPSQSLDY